MPVHLTAPVLRSTPSNTSLVVGNRLPLRAHVEQVDEEVVGQRAGPVGEHAVRGAVGIDVDRAQAADQRRQLRRGERQKLRLVDQQRLGGHGVAGLLVVAEAVSDTARGSEKDSASVCACEASVRPGANGTATLWPAAFAACSTPALPARTIRSASETFLPPLWSRLNSNWMRSRALSTLASCSGWLASQSFCGARRMRAPLAPPRLSPPRKVEAEAQAVPTSSDDGEAGGQHLGLERRGVRVVDQRMIDRRHRILPDQLFLRHFRSEIARARAEIAMGRA